MRPGLTKRLTDLMRNCTLVFFFFFFFLHMRYVSAPSNPPHPFPVSGLPQLRDAWLHGGQPHPGALHHPLQQRLPVDPAHGAQQTHGPPASRRRLPLHPGGAGLFGDSEVFVGHACSDSDGYTATRGSLL